jgi:hypothetical protein
MAKINLVSLLNIVTTTREMADRILILEACPTTSGFYAPDQADGREHEAAGPVAHLGEAGGAVGRSSLIYSPKGSQSIVRPRPNGRDAGAPCSRPHQTSGLRAASSYCKTRSSPFLPVHASMLISLAHFRCTSGNDDEG